MTRVIGPAGRRVGCIAVRDAATDLGTHGPDQRTLLGSVEPGTVSNSELAPVSGWPNVLKTYRTFCYAPTPNLRLLFEEAAKVQSRARWIPTLTGVIKEDNSGLGVIASAA
jgi:hypothetical protein